MSNAKPLKSNLPAMGDYKARPCLSFDPNEATQTTLYHETKFEKGCSLIPTRESAENRSGMLVSQHNTTQTPQVQAFESLPVPRYSSSHRTSFKTASLSQIKTPRTKKSRRAHLIPPGCTGDVAKCFNYRQFEDSKVHSGRKSAEGIIWQSQQLDNLLKTSCHASSRDPKTINSTSISGARKGHQNPAMQASSIFDKGESFKEKRLITGCVKGCYNKNQNFSDVIVAHRPPEHKKMPVHPTLMSHLENSIMGLLPSDEKNSNDLGKYFGRKRFNVPNISSLSSGLVPTRQDLDRFLVSRPAKSINSISRKAADIVTAGLHRGLCRIPSNEHLMDAQYRAGVSKIGKRHYCVPWSEDSFTSHETNTNFVKKTSDSPQ